MCSTGLSRRSIAATRTGLLATMHFPHYRLADATMRVWDEPEESYQ
jgi:hypothetical protein